MQRNCNGPGPGSSNVQVGLKDGTYGPGQSSDLKLCIISRSRWRGKSTTSTRRIQALCVETSDKAVSCEISEKGRHRLPPPNSCKQTPGLILLVREHDSNMTHRMRRKNKGLTGN